MFLKTNKCVTFVCIDITIRFAHNAYIVAVRKLMRRQHNLQTMYGDVIKRRLQHGIFGKQLTARASFVRTFAKWIVMLFHYQCILHNSTAAISYVASAMYANSIFHFNAKRWAIIFSLELIVTRDSPRPRIFFYYFMLSWIIVIEHYFIWTKSRPHQHVSHLNVLYTW